MNNIIKKNLKIKSCYEINKDTLEKTNNIILPNNILEIIIDEKIANYFFKITNNTLDIHTFVGVLEFGAPDDTVIVPFWIYEYLVVDNDSIVEVELIKNIIKGRKVVLEPQDELFFKIPEYDVILETLLSQFSVLQYNSLIKLNILDNIYYIKIKDIEHNYDSLFEDNELKDNNMNINIEVIDIINTDLTVEISNKFLMARLKKEKEEQEEKLRKEKEEKLRKEKEEKLRKEKEEEENNKNKPFVAFSGKGHRLGGN